MAYRKSAKYRQQLANMRAAKAAKRESRPSPDYPTSLPDLRRRIIIEDFDFGQRVLAGLRMSMPRVGAE